MRRDMMRFEGPREWEKGRCEFWSVCGSVVAGL